MRVHSRRFGVLVAAVGGVLVLAALAPAPAVARPAQVSPPVPVLDWHTCGSSDAQCATATVPRDYDRPAGPTIDLALARIRGTDQAHRIGTVFVNPGGPGGSGVGLVLSGFGDQLAEHLHGRFDVVGFDPRGVGASHPLRCFDSAQQEMDYISRVPLFPYRRQQFRPFYDNRSALADRCLGRGQDIARSMSTADVVRDLDLLRRAVGDTRLTYLGFSYGTYIGNTYANMFPRTIRALVIDGVLDPRLWSSGRQVRSDRVATQHEFAEFLRLCDRAGPQCAFSTPEGSRRRWDRLADRIRRAPVTLPDGSVYSYDFLVTDATFAMYDPETWGGTAGFGALFDSVADAALGGSAAAHRVSGLRRALLDRLRPPLAQAEEYDSLGAYYGNQCADTRYPRSFGAFRAIGAYAEAGSRFGPFWWWQNTPCARWPVAPDRYTGPWRTRTSAPVLVVGNYFDGITGYAGAKASARLLRGSRLLSYAGWGHTAYGRNPCTEAHVDRYLLSGTLPPVGTVCPANPNPFLTQTQRTSAGAPLVGRPPSWLVRH